MYSSPWTVALFDRIHLKLKLVMFTVGLIQVLLEVISWLDSYCSCIRSTALDSWENVCSYVYFYECCYMWTHQTPGMALQMTRMFHLIFLLEPFVDSLQQLKQLWNTLSFYMLNLWLPAVWKTIHTYSEYTVILHYSSLQSCHCGYKSLIQQLLWCERVQW